MGKGKFFEDEEPEPEEDDSSFESILAMREEMEKVPEVVEVKKSKREEP